MVHSLYKAARLAIFFGTPHRGFNVDDILGMINRSTGADRIKLVESLQPGSRVLEVGLQNFREMANRTGLQVSTFYETMKTQRPVKVSHGTLALVELYLTSLRHTVRGWL